MNKVSVGLDVLVSSTTLQKQFKGNVALLCHNASVDGKMIHATFRFKELFGKRFIKLFGPQHGFSTDVQDNMIESEHNIHPYFNIPVYSLYSETRIPTDNMLADIDHLFVDLQDVGCRMYTYIYTLTLLLEKCANKNIEVIILDRPNPLGGEEIEGNVLDANFSSFIGLHPIPVRHGMTIGEVACMHQQYWTKQQTNVKVINMQGWERTMLFPSTGIEWLLPSPNLSRWQSAFTFPSTVIFEGTLLSEGRGTTQALELVGHPSIEPYKLSQHFQNVIDENQLQGVVIRPITFLPTFNKHEGSVCGGFQLNITDYKRYKPWRTGQILMRELYQIMQEQFIWLAPPYEYEYKKQPIDIINGTDKIRHWVESNKSLDDLIQLETVDTYKEQLNSIKLY